MRTSILGGPRFFCILAMMCSTAVAQEPPKPDNIEKEFLMAQRNPKEFRRTVLFVQMALGQMGYGTGPFSGELDQATRKAVDAFRAKHDLRGKPGELDGRTFVGIMEAWKSVSKILPTLPMHGVYVEFWDDYVSAKGTWIIEGQEQGIPLQTTEIQCRRALGLCLEATALLIDGDHLTAWLESHEIERWDEHEIVTKPRDLECVRYTMRISRSQKSATGLRATTKTSAACSHIEAKDFRLKLVDGLEATSTYLHKHREALRKHLQVTDTQLSNPE